MLKLIRKMLEAYMELLIEKIQEYKNLHSKDSFNLIAGRKIEEISNLYPASYEDAAIIYEEWCKGLLSECRPDELKLREYAKYVGDPDKYKQWAAESQLMQECEFYRMRTTELEKTENAINQIENIIENAKQRYADIMWQKVNDVPDLTELHKWEAIIDLQHEIEEALE